MPVLHVSVAGKTATYRQREDAIVCGNNDYRIAFTFDEEWAGYENKTARFIWGGTYYDVDFTGNEVAVPVIPDATEVLVGLYVGDLIRTTTMASIPCWPSVTSGGEQPNPGYGGQYVEEIRASAARAEGAADEAEQSASAAAAAAARAEAAASGTSAGVIEEIHTELAKKASVEAVRALRKRIVNLEQGLAPEAFVTDPTAAHAKTVPTEALSFAQVDAIGGLTYKEGTTLRDTKVTALVSAAINGTELTRIAIPAEVQALDGYGWGISAGLYNGIEWDEDGKVRFVKRVGRMTLDGTEAGWWRGSTEQGTYFCRSVSTASGGSTVNNKMASGWPATVGTPSLYFSEKDHIVFPGDLATTLDAWKAKLAEWAAEGNPLTVYYKLATPIVTDVSAYITADNMIAVEPGGLITAENTHNAAAPSAITYELAVGSSVEDVAAAFDEVHTYAREIITGGTA